MIIFNGLNKKQPPVDASVAKNASKTSPVWAVFKYNEKPAFAGVFLFIMIAFHFLRFIIDPKSKKLGSGLS